MTEEAIRECPFCGDEAYVASAADDSMFYVACTSVECFCAMGEGYDRDAMPEHSFRSREAAIAAWNRRAGGERERGWQPIETAPKDGTTIWAVLHHDLYPGVKPGRKDLEHWNGLQIPLRHPGIYESDGRIWDHGWNIAAPVGHGGFPDEWIAGWRPLPTPPRAALAEQTEGERNGG